MVSNMLKGIETGTTPEPVIQETPAATEEPPKHQKINFKKIFKDNEVICLICNQGFKTLKRHLQMSHQLTDKEYRTQFNIPASQSLVAKAYSEERKKAALDRGQGDILAKARAAKAATKAEAAAKPAKATKTP